MKPLAVFCLTLCCGIAAVRVVDGYFTVLLAAGYGLTALVSVVVMLAYRFKAPTTATLAMSTLGFTLGMGRTAHYYLSLKAGMTVDSCFLSGIVASPPSTTTNRTSFLFYSYAPRHAWYSVSIWRSRDEAGYDPALGDALVIAGQPQASHSRGNPDEFDYGSWLWVQGISGIVNVEASGIFRSPDDGSGYSAISPAVRMRVGALQWRERLLARLKSLSMPDDITAMLSAIALGDRTSVGPGLKEMYSEAGASHLLALSGLHLGLVTGMILWLMQGLRFNRRWRLYANTFLLAVVWTFAFLAGLPTSLLRASLMTTFWLAAASLERADSPLQHLLLAVTAMLLWHPPFLFDVGAQLSCAAVVGILVGMPLIEYSIGDERLFKVRLKLMRLHLLAPVKLLLVLCCAQMATLPLLVYYFNSFSPYAPLFNLVYIPLTVFLVAATFLLLVMATAFAAGAATLAMGLVFVAGLQWDVMRYQNSLPLATLHVVPYRKAQPQLLVYNNRSCPAMHIVLAPDKSYLLMPRAEDVYDGLHGIRHTFWHRRLTAEPVVLDNVNKVRLYGKTLLMLNRRQGRVARSACSEGIDLLWLCDKFNGSLHDIPVKPRLVVLDPSLSSSGRRRIASEAASLGVACYDIALQGALQLRLPL